MSLKTYTERLLDSIFKTYTERLLGSLTDKEHAILDARLGGQRSDNPLVAAKHEAERRIRAKFQERYGSFWKCTTCGAAKGGGRSGMELPGGVSIWRGYNPCEHAGTHVVASYAPPRGVCE